MQSVKVNPSTAVRLVYYFCVAQILLWAWLKGNGVLKFALEFALTPVIAIVVLRVM